MDSQEHNSEGLSKEELDATEGRRLPTREAMSILDANVTIPADPALAAAVLAGEPLDEPGAEAAGPEGSQDDAEPDAGSGRTG